MAYVCAELEKVRNIYGGYDCKMWVEYQPNANVLSSLAITKQQMYDISLALGGCFGVIIAFVIVAKGLKSM